MTAIMGTAAALWFGSTRPPWFSTADDVGPIHAVAGSSPPRTVLSSRPATHAAPVVATATTPVAVPPVLVRRSRMPSSSRATDRATPRPVPDPVATTRATVDPEPPVEQERDVSIDLTQGAQLMDVDYWGHMPQVGADLNITGTGLEIATDRAGIAIVPTANWATCSTRTSWAQVVRYSSLRPGSQLCAYTPERRFARLAVEVVPGGEGSQLRFYGYTWDVAR